MASRYMNYMRKNAKVVLVFMGVVCMVTFVVGPYLLDLVTGAQRSRQNENPIAVKWTKASVRESELHTLRYRHGVVYRYLVNVVHRAIELGGKPMVNGQPVTLDPRSFNVGIPPDDSDEDLMQTMILA